MKKYLVSLGYEDCDRIRYFLGFKEVIAQNKKEAKEKLFDMLWDDRLDSASCVPFFMVNQVFE